ncbi:helix-turn-helix domain-containing protein [Effusibacillus consociatus]|uniref:Helix-turn-helix domain-containing protein n=1 Tax=Effusibacillus consociatus TaxID=1117041 RepID=A0ABV9Q337_9BACL
MLIGEKIKNLREARGWTQIYLAEKIGMNNSVLSRIEAGKRPVEDHEIKQFADVFEVSTDYLLGRTTEIAREDRTNYTLGQPSDLSPEDLEILEMIKNDPEIDLFFKDFKDAPDEHKRDLIKIWKALHGEKK